RRAARRRGAHGTDPRRQRLRRIPRWRERASRRIDRRAGPVVMARSHRAATVLFCFVLGWIVPAPAADVPFLTGRVVDNAEILKRETRDRLAVVLKSHEEATTNQIAVLTIPTIGEEAIEEYAVKVFESWKLGQKGKDNGVLLVVAPKDRKLRIEVGYGLEGALTDAVSSRIIRNVITPSFKAGDFDK